MKEFRFVEWEFKGVKLAMFADAEGNLYCLTEAICTAFGVVANTVRRAASRNSSKFNTVSVSDIGAEQFIQLNKSRYGVDRLKKNTQVWSDKAMIRIGLALKSDKAEDFMEDIVELIRANARVNFVSISRYEELLGVINTSLKMNEQKCVELDRKYERLLSSVQPSLDRQASLAGQMLREQAVILPFRKLTPVNSNFS